MKETYVKGYAATFAILLGLAFVNIFLSKQELGGMNTALILGIACVQAFILAAFFMHLRESPRFTWVIVFSGFFFVGVFAVYVAADSRGRATQTPITTWEQREKITLPARGGDHPAPAAHAAPASSAAPAPAHEAAK